jgi:putative membrane protein
MLSNAEMSSTQTSPKDTGTILAEERTDLAYQRSVLAAERTLMAWIRTALSMIGFGFTIYKFFQYLPEDLATNKVAHPQAPRNLGLTLVAIGTVSLAAAAWQHLHFLKQLGASPKESVRSVSFAVAMAVVLVGILAFYGVFMRQGPF